MWRPHLILPLPKSYDELFSLFFGQTCINCAKTPTHPMICLLCGQLCCLDKCCDIDGGMPGLPPNEVERVRGPFYAMMFWVSSTLMPAKWYFSTPLNAVPVAVSSLRSTPRLWR